jgi:ectoine hydroxylase-related dioxygenase (phytanoyl-CoA dioxygenase family)
MLEAELEQFERDGFVILESVLDATALAELTAGLAPYEANRPMGRNAFEGQKSQRVYSLAAKGDVFLRLAEHPRVMALVERLLMPNFLLSTLQSIRLHPGEQAQAWHADDFFYFMPRPHRLPLAVSVIWALEDFTEENGATEVIAGSHRWPTQHPEDADHDITQAVMRAGSAIVFDGALWHRGGANQSSGTRLAISPQYCQPWLRPQESQLLIVPPDAARACTERMRSMLGYSIHPPFIGQVDGMHPLRLVDAGYNQHKTEARIVADRVLVRPTANMVES